MSCSIPLASMITFVTAYSQSDLFGKLIFWGLISLSLICWYVLIHKIWITQKIKKTSLDFKSAFDKNKELLFSLDLDAMPKPASREIAHPFAEIFLSLKQKTLEILEKNHFFAAKNPSQPPQDQVYLSPADLEVVESHVLTKVSEQAKYLEKNLFVLSMIATLAPFLGLLGTVWGILLTFSALNSGAAASSNSVILGGLSTALTTTVLGLLIAIPALISFSYLKNLTKRMASDMEDFLYLLLSQVELQYRKVDFL